jgi:NAD(P)-dependent dehydrogenase (short-subunit alcohol dehydrogenase family)
MLLKDKVAVIYGAGGGIGAAVGRAFADEGAALFLTGTTWRPSRSSPRRSWPPADPPKRRRWTRWTRRLSMSISDQ